jgi:Xaa-Pro aminopeptidase
MSPSAKRQHTDNSARLVALRAELARLKLDAFIVPSDDPHQSEYVAACYERRAFISGFDGSAGTAVVTAKEALLWTDGRYFLQATQQLGEGWTLMKDRLPETVSIDAWLAARDGIHAVGVDPLLMAASAVGDLRASLGAAGKELRSLRANPVDAVWGAARPAPPRAPTFSFDEAVAGQSVADKLRKMDSALAAAGADVLVVTALDEVAWLFNVRGGDIDFCPVSYAYATVHRAGEGADRRIRARWYIENSKVGADVLARLRASAGDGADVEVRAYDAVVPDVEAAASAGLALLIPNAASAALHELVPAPQLRARASPIALLKACKNEHEVAGMREAHLRDARALCRFLAWLDATDGGATVNGGARLTEVAAAEKLSEFRKGESGYIGPSFETISAYGANGAVIHYTAAPSSCATLGAESLYLLDSGGQYGCGTTDVTRTVSLAPSAAPAHVRACWTRVLQAHIAVDSLVFPEGTTGYQLDAVARAPLWKAGLDYRHGTRRRRPPHALALAHESTVAWLAGWGMRRAASSLSACADALANPLARLALLPRCRRLLPSSHPGRAQAPATASAACSACTRDRTA